MQGAGQAQANDGEGLVEPLTHRGSRSGMVAFKRTGQVVKTPFPERRRFTLEGLVQTPRDLGVLVIGQMGEDISPLMHLAALNGSSLAVDLGNGATQRLRPVDDEQHRTLSGQPPLDQVGEQGAGLRRRGRVQPAPRSG